MSESFSYSSSDSEKKKYEELLLSFKNIETLKQQLKSGDNTTNITKDLTSQIDLLPRKSYQADIGIDTAVDIVSQVSSIKPETAAAIIKIFFERYKEKSIILLTAIKYESDSSKVQSIVAPFLQYPLLKGLIKSDISSCSDISLLKDGRCTCQKEGKESFIIVFYTFLFRLWYTALQKTRKNSPR